MPDPTPDPNFPKAQRVAYVALGAGVGIMLLKLGVFGLTNSVAVLSDALESIINIAAAAAMIFAIHYANRPADRTHPYGHGKIEFMAVGLEGWLILFAGAVIGYEAISRLITEAPPQRLDWGVSLLGIVAIADAVLAGYVYRMGRKYDNNVLIADGKHLLTDVASTVGVIAALILVKVTGKAWLDPVAAMVIAAAVLFASWRLLWHSYQGLMDQADPKDVAAVNAILDDEVAQGQIHSYHKVRLRHQGAFHWVDLHLQVDGTLTVTQGHAIASRIEKRIEDHLGEANATAHVEPAVEDVSAQHD